MCGQRIQSRNGAAVAAATAVVVIDGRCMAHAWSPLQLLILCHGGNDLLRKLDIGKMESNLRNMIQLSLDRDIPVILLGVPKPGLFLSSFDIYKEIAISMDVIFIEDLIPDILSDKSLKSDTVHPNKEGYSLIAEEIYLLLQDTGAI